MSIRIVRIKLFTIVIVDKREEHDRPNKLYFANRHLRITMLGRLLDVQNMFLIVGCVCE